MMEVEKVEEEAVVEEKVEAMDNQHNKVSRHYKCKSLHCKIHRM